MRALVALPLIAAVALARPAAAQEQRVDESSDRPLQSEQGSGLPVSWIVVGVGVAMVFAAIPLIVQADMRVHREEGVAVGRRNANCSASPTVCGALASTDTNATPYWVGAGVVAGLGIGVITTGAILHWKVPSTRGEPFVSVTPTPGGATASLELGF
jgi:hypothetical protein